MKGSDIATPMVGRWAGGPVGRYDAAMAASPGRRAPDTRPGRITPMWLAHHYPEDYHRCVLVGRSYVCRRCLVLYPVAFAVAFATLRWHPGETTDSILLFLLPLPAVIELVLEQFGVLTYDPRRQVLVTVPLALGLGRGFAVYLNDITSLRFWIPIVVYFAICFCAVAWNRRTQGRRPRREVR